MRRLLIPLKPHTILSKLCCHNSLTAKEVAVVKPTNNLGFLTVFTAGRRRAIFNYLCSADVGCDHAVLLNCDIVIMLVVEYAAFLY